MNKPSDYIKKLAAKKGLHIRGMDDHKTFVVSWGEMNAHVVCKNITDLNNFVIGY